MIRLSLLKTTLASSLVLSSSMVWAESFEFDRPGQGLGTGIVPKGHVAWEQSLPSLSYNESRDHGVTHKILTLQGDALLRVGVGADTELRLGWDGPIWQRDKTTTQNRTAPQKTEIDGVGDVQLGIKKAIDLKDEKLKWALLAQVNLATGDDEFTADDEIYTLGSALSYQFDENVSTALTMLYDYQDGHLAWTAIPSIGYPVTEKISGFTEYVFRKAEHEPRHSVLNTGLVWSVTNDLQLDASVGVSFNRQQPQYNAGLGFAYLF